MNNYIRTIIATLVFTYVTAEQVLAQVQTEPPLGFGSEVPNFQRTFQILQWGAMSQIATAMILLIGLFTILARLRRIEEALQKTK